MDIYNDDYILAEGEKNGVFKESLDKERAIGRLQRETFKAAFKAGVKMIYGTDAGVYPHGDNAKQFAKMVEWGMTPMQAIQSATVNGGRGAGRTAMSARLPWAATATSSESRAIRSRTSRCWRRSRS